MRDVELAPDFDAEERWRRHADDRHLVAVKRDGLLQDVGAAAEFTLPERVADHRDRDSRMPADRRLARSGVRSAGATPSVSKNLPDTHKPST